MSNVAKLKKRALEYEQKKQFDKALDAYMQVLGALGDHVEEADVALFNRVGDLLLRQGNVSSAVDHYERAVDLYTEGGFHNNAIALCSKILRNAPGRNSIYYKLGRISAKKGFTSDAKSNFLEYADRMQRIGHVEEAFRALKEFADLCPDQDDIRLMLADQLVRGDRKDEAIEQLQSLFEKFESEGRAQEAKATMERMKTIDPSHQPRPGVMRPTPKANDLIFLDVNYDGPGRQPKTPTGSVPLVDTPAGAAPVEDMELHSPHLATEPALPMLDVDRIELVDIAPVDGLSSGAGFDTDAGTPDSRANGLTSQIDPELIMGFEETSLGGGAQESSAVSPLADIQQSTPLGLDAGEPSALPVDSESPPAAASTERVTSAGTGDVNEDDDLPLLDISLDLTDADDASSGGDLTFVFPGDEADQEWNTDASAAGAPAADDVSAGAAADQVDMGHAAADPMDPASWALHSEDDLRLEPLLQLPDLEPDADAMAELGQEQDLPLIAQSENVSWSGSWTGTDTGEMEVDDSPSSGPELQFLDTGNDEDRVVHSGSTEIPGFEFLDIGVPASEPSDDEPSTLDALRARIDLDPHDCNLRRRFAEALLEAGDREGGLNELEAAMLGFERAGDGRSAKAIVDEMIRVEPREVRYHQKRVEYAVLSNDRSLLAEAYYSLAENLFQMGELAKSRAVYARVLELTPGDSRVRAALEGIDATGVAEEPVAEREPAELSTSAPIEVPTEVAVEAPTAPPPEARADAPADVHTNVPVEAPTELPTEPPTEAPVDARTDARTDAPLVAPLESALDTSAANPSAIEELGTETPAEPWATSVADRLEEPAVALPPSEPVRPPAPAAADFVNLADWLSEDEPARNTRMVVDVKEPEIQEQVDFGEMLAMFKQGVAANVDEADHEAHYDLGVAYKEMGLLDEAISEFQKALRGTESRTRTYEALGQCFVEKGQHQIAVTILSRALGDKSNTDDMLVGVLYLLGFASETLGRWADAQRFYERVFAVDIEFRDIAERLAVAERGGGGK